MSDIEIGSTVLYTGHMYARYQGKLKLNDVCIVLDKRGYDDMFDGAALRVKVLRTKKRVWVDSADVRIKPQEKIQLKKVEVKAKIKITKNKVRFN